MHVKLSSLVRMAVWLRVDLRYGRVWLSASVVLCSAFIGRRFPELTFSVDFNPF